MPTSNSDALSPLDLLVVVVACDVQGEEEERMNCNDHPRQILQWTKKEGHSHCVCVRVCVRVCVCVCVMHTANVYNKEFFQEFETRTGILLFHSLLTVLVAHHHQHV